MPRPLFRVMLGLLHLAYRAFGSRMRVQGLQLLELETIGAKSGAKRRSLLGSFPDPAAEQGAGAEPGGSWLVVASNAGSARHPAWFLNLTRHPDRVWISVGGRRIKVLPETLEGTERQDAWRRVTSRAPGYGRYQEATDRVIPLVRLRAEEESR